MNKHNVIYISFNTGNDTFKTYQEYKKYFVSKLIRDIREYCPDIKPDDLLSDIFTTAYRKTQQGFIFIIDEWDYIFNTDLYTKDDRRNFLRFLEGLLKDKSYYDAESKDIIDSENLALSAMTILGFLSYYDYQLKIPNRLLRKYICVEFVTF